MSFSNIIKISFRNALLWRQFLITHKVLLLSPIVTSQQLYFLNSVRNNKRVFSSRTGPVVKLTMDDRHCEETTEVTDKMNTKYKRVTEGHAVEGSEGQVTEGHVIEGSEGQVTEGNESQVAEGSDSQATEGNEVHPTEGIEQQLQGNTASLSRRALKRLRRERLRKGHKVKKQKLRDSRDDEDSRLVTSEAMSETSYFVENGLRKVRPYFYTFTTYAKGRWCGRQILDVFMEEFGGKPVEYQRKAFELGRVKVNGEHVTGDYIIKDNDFISNTAHRHELPVLDSKIDILQDDGNMLVVNKPSSMPVHPCGRYRHNSLLFILAKEYDIHNIRVLYRLDRLTSGLLIFCRSEDMARKFHKAISSRNVHKEYVCRVDGEFPKGEVECSEPIDVLSNKLGVFMVGPNGKQSKTKFERLSYNGTTSVVKCEPLTGRTHQIRVHLQYLGYPIVNDPIYNCSAWGPEKGKAGQYNKTTEQLIEDISATHHPDLHILPQSDSQHNSPTKPTSFASSDDSDNHTPQSQSTKTGITNCDNASTQKTSLSSCVKLHTDLSSGDCKCKPDEGSNCESTLNETSSSFDESCYFCCVKHREPQKEDLVMFLHAYRYKGASWDYSTPLPVWAADDWSGNNPTENK